MKLQKMIQILETLEKKYFDAQIASQHLEVCRLPEISSINQSILQSINKIQV